MIQPNNPVARSERRLLLVAGSAYAVGIFSSWTIPVQIDELMEHFAKSAPHAGLLATGQMMLLGVAAFIAPTIGRRLTAPRLATLGCLLAIFGFTLAAISHGIEGQLWLAFALCGIGQGIAGAAGSGLAATSRRPVRLFSQVVAGASAYSAVWLLAIPQLRQLMPSIHVSFWACAAAIAVCAIIAAALGSTFSAPLQAEATSGPSGLNRNSLLLLAGSFMVFAPAQALWSFADQLGGRLHLPAAQIGALLFASTMAGVVGPLAAPALAAKWGNRLALDAILALTAAVCVVGSTTHVVPLFVTCIVALAFLQMALVPLLFGMAVQLDAGVAPLVYGSILFGCSVGPLLGGLAFEPTGRRLAEVCFALCGLSWAMTRGVREGKHASTSP